MKRTCTSLAIALGVAACGRDAPPPAPHPRPITAAPPTPNLVVERIVAGDSELFVRLPHGCETLAVRDRPGGNAQRIVELDVRGQLGCNPVQARITLDITDREHLHATSGSRKIRGRAGAGTRCVGPRLATETRSAREAVVDGAQLFADRARCEASTYASSGPSCLRDMLAEAVANSRDDVPTDDFVKRFDAMLADPKATVWTGFGPRCDEWRIERQPKGVTFRRTSKEDGLTVVRESYWDYDAVCKRAAWGGSSVTKTAPDGGGTGSAGGGNDELPLERYGEDPDMLPLYPGGWFYNREACQRASFQ